MRKNAFTWWQVLLMLGVAAILTSMLWPVGSRARLNAQRSSCQSNLKQIGLAMNQYVRDYDEKYPLLNAGKTGWMTSIMPYIKRTQLFQCPSDKANYLDGSTDYFYNVRMSGQNMNKPKNMMRTIMNGEGLGNAPTNAGLTQLPLGWKNNLKSPAYRHLEGANYSFVDGHVKWLKPENVSNAKPNSSVATFALW